MTVEVGKAEEGLKLTMAIQSNMPRLAYSTKVKVSFNPSSALPTSTVISFTDIPKPQFCLCILPARVPPGIYLMSAILPLKHLKRLSPQLWSLPIGSRTLKLQLRLMPLTMHLLLSFQLLLTMATCTLLDSTPGLFLPQKSTTMSMTKSYSQFLKLSNDGDITSKGSGLLINCGHQSLEFAILFQWPKSSCMTSTLVQICFWFQPDNLFPSWKTWNQTWHTH